MPGLYKDEGIVLKTIKLGEADRILTVYTRYNGKLSAVAKGVRKTKSRFGGRLEPFTRVQLIFYRGRNLDTVTGADILESFKGVRDDLESLTSAAALAELVDKVTPERERSLSVYALLLAGLHCLEEGGGCSVVPGFYLKLLSVAGYHPQLEICSVCGTSDVAGFSAALGGAVCGLCHHRDPDAEQLLPEQLQLLERLLSSDLGTPTDEPAAAYATRLLRRYAEYHLERPLRSLGVATN
jgi:DNA repair protein RecO (recombination protein O)